MSIFVNMSMDISSNTEESKFSELFEKKLKIPKNEIEVFCENQHFAICKKSIISSFQFTPLILQLIYAILNHRFSKFGLVKFGNSHFNRYMRYYRGETKQSARSLFMGHLLDTQKLFYGGLKSILYFSKVPPFFFFASYGHDSMCARLACSQGTSQIL